MRPKRTQRSNLTQQGIYLKSSEKNSGHKRRGFWSYLGREFVISQPQNSRIQHVSPNHQIHSQAFTTTRTLQFNPHLGDKPARMSESPTLGHHPRHTAVMLGALEPGVRSIRLRTAAKRASSKSRMSGSAPRHLLVFHCPSKHPGTIPPASLFAKSSARGSSVESRT